MSNTHSKEDLATPVGTTNWRNSNIPFGIKDKDRLRHLYVIGKTGVGKSTLLQTMAISDIERGKGTCIIDPHGDIAESILNYVPKERIGDVIYFNAGDTGFPIAFNPLQAQDTAHNHLIVSGLLATFKKIWFDSWGPRMEYILHFALLTLLSYPGATLLDIQPLLVDKELRLEVLRHTKNSYIRAFWFHEFDKYPYALRIDAITPILNKTGTFITNEILRNIIGHKSSRFDIRRIMDEGKILICNLSKGIIGEEVCSLLGSMILNAVQLAAIQRASIKEEDRRPFFLYIDEMHSFISLSFIDILTEARKYGLSLFLTHQYLDQLNEKVRAAVIGNVGTLISFRLGSEDAIVLEREFKPVFFAEDLVNLPRYAVYLKLMIDGTTSKPFSATTRILPPFQQSCKDTICSLSQQKFGAVIHTVKQKILLNTMIGVWEQVSNRSYFRGTYARELISSQVDYLSLLE